VLGISGFGDGGIGVSGFGDRGGGYTPKEEH
jgi:hypothetical protein